MNEVVCETCLKPIGPLPFYAVHVECCAESDHVALDSQEFFELMQAYRHAPLQDQSAVAASFEAVKAFIRNPTREANDGN